VVHPEYWINLPPHFPAVLLVVIDDDKFGQDE
jgi:hypothetical protein